MQMSKLSEMGFRMRRDWRSSVRLEGVENLRKEKRLPGRRLKGRKVRLGDWEMKGIEERE